jgi:hypothetical protein
VLKLMAQMGHYADQVLAIANLDTHQASAITPEYAEDSTLVHQDFPTNKSYATARAKALTTFPVPSWTPNF